MIRFVFVSSWPTDANMFYDAIGAFQLNIVPAFYITIIFRRCCINCSRFGCTDSVVGQVLQSGYSICGWNFTVICTIIFGVALTLFEILYCLMYFILLSKSGYKSDSLLGMEISFRLVKGVSLLILFCVPSMTLLVI